MGNGLCTHQSHPESSQLLTIIAQIITIVGEIGTNAPFGVGIVVTTITNIANQLNIRAENNIYVRDLLKNIQIICGILVNIRQIPEQMQHGVAHANENISNNLHELFEYVEKINECRAITNCILAKKHKSQLLQLYASLKDSQDTLMLALIVQTQVQQTYHNIPGSNPSTWSHCRPISVDIGQIENQCMIENKKTGLRCRKINPKYKLESNVGQNVYLSCGSCAKDTASAWWKPHYKRVLRAIPGK